MYSSPLLLPFPCYPHCISYMLTIKPRRPHILSSIVRITACGIFHAYSPNRVISSSTNSLPPLPPRFCRLTANSFGKEFVPLNLDKLDDFIVRGKVDASAPIDMRVLYEAGLVKNIKDGVKLLGRGPESFPHVVDIEVSKASQ